MKGVEEGTHVVSGRATELLVKVLKLGVEPGPLLLLSLDLLQQPRPSRGRVLMLIFCIKICLYINSSLRGFNSSFFTHKLFTENNTNTVSSSIKADVILWQDI